jgi:hypothetical protein
LRVSERLARLASARGVTAARARINDLMFAVQQGRRLPSSPEIAARRTDGCVDDQPFSVTRLRVTPVRLYD